MMDALNTLAKPAPETATGTKSSKGGMSAGKAGFANELKELSDQQGGGKGAARGAETKAVSTDAEADTSVAVPAETTGEDVTAGAGTFAALRAGLRTAIDATLEQVAAQSDKGTASDAASTSSSTKSGKTAKTRGVDFTSLGIHAESKAILEGNAASEVVRKAKIAAKGEVDKAILTKEALSDDVAEVDSGAPIGESPQPETLSDVLGLLAATAAAGQSDGKTTAIQGRAAETKGVSAKVQAEDVSNDTTAADEAADALPTDEAQEDRLFRLVRGEGRGQSVGLKIASDSNGRIDVETRSATGGQAETVNVVEARRYLGFNAPSNSSSLTAAMAGNDEWVSAMHPSARLANEAQQSSTGQVVNTLKLELNPISLGTVTAMLRLSGDELNVHLTVQTAAAYRELSSDSNSMMDALRSQGFSVDQVTVSMAPVASSQDTGDTSGRFNQQQQQNMQQAAGEGSRNGDQGARQNARGGSDGQPGIVAGRIDESEQVSSVLRGAGGARPDHVYI